MSDLRKWLKIMESAPAVFPGQESPERLIKKDATVMVNPNSGGGTGRYMHSTPNGAMIDIKGVARELSEDDFSLPERDYEDPYQKGNDWFHMSQEPDSIGRMNDKPEFRPGDMVKIADVYGAVIGPGFGVFVGYGTTGEDCIVLFDGKQIVVPVENVAAVLEQNAKDNFGEMDNDGNLSPMSLGSDNVKIEQPQNSGMQSREPEMDQRDEFSRWMKSVEEALSNEGKELAEDMPMQSNNCGCGSWDCPVCFPEQNEMPGLNGQLDGIGGMRPENNVVGGPGQSMPAAPQCPVCGNGDQAHDHEVDSALDVGMNDIAFDMSELEEVGIDDGMMDDGMMDEEPMDMSDDTDNVIEKPRSGKGVKMGEIVQTTEFRKSGQESPMTYGDDNLDEGPDYIDQEEYEMGSPLSQRDVADDMEPQGEDERLQIIQSIMSMQAPGLSKANVQYSEEQLAMMNPSQLRKAQSAVMNGTVAEELPVMMETKRVVKKQVAPKLRESAPVRRKLSLFEQIRWDIKLKEAFDELEEELIDESSLSRLLGKQKGGQNLVRWMHRRHGLGNDAELTPASFSERIFWKQFKSHPDTFVVVSAEDGVAGIKPDKKFIDNRTAEFAKKGKTYNPSGDSTLPYQIIAFKDDGEQIDPELLRAPKADGEEDYRDAKDPTVMRARMGKHNGRDMQNAFNVFNLLAEQIGPLKTVWISGFENDKDAGPGKGSVERDKMKQRADMKAGPAFDEQQAIATITKKVEPVLQGLLSKVQLPAGFNFSQQVVKAVSDASGGQPGSDEYTEFLQAATAGNSTALKPVLDALKRNLMSLT